MKASAKPSGRHSAADISTEARAALASRFEAMAWTMYWVEKIAPTVPSTQAEIVGLTGRKRPALSRALNRMKALGLVKPAGFGEACHNTAPLLWVACGELS